MDLHDFADVAENYDYYLSSLAHSTNDDLINFHITLADKYGKDGVLDIGCGTGILTIPLVMAGFNVTSIDLSAPMIEVTRQKLMKSGLSADLITANMTSFKLDRKYSLAMIPRSGFMHLLTVEEQRCALCNIYDHLTDGGVLTLNTFQPHPAVQSNQMKTTPEQFTFRAEYINRDGFKEKIYNAITYNYLTQIMSGNWKFETYDKDDKIIDIRIRPIAMRQTYRYEMQYMLELCGFEVLNLYNDYVMSPYNGNCIWVARKIGKVKE